MNDNKWLLLAVLVLAGVLLWLLTPILAPFLVAAALAYMGDPLVDRLEARRLSRTHSVLVVYGVIVLALMAVLLIVLPLVEQQLVHLISVVPGYFDLLQQRLSDVLMSVGVSPETLDLGRLKQAVMAHWSALGDAAGSVAQSVLSSGMSMMAWLANLLLIPVVTFYFLRDWDEMVERVQELLPRRWAPDVTRLASNADEVLGAFLRGQLLVMLALGTLYVIGLAIVGLEFALLIGLLAGVLSFVPYLGVVTGLGLAGLAAYLQFHDWPHFLGVFAVFGVGQLLEGMVLTPMLVGDRIGLHPVAVIFAVMAGGQLFGFVGMLLALPAAAVLMVLLRYAHERYLNSRLYNA